MSASVLHLQGLTSSFTTTYKFVQTHMQKCTHQNTCIHIHKHTYHWDVKNRKVMFLSVHTSSPCDSHLSLTWVYTSLTFLICLVTFFFLREENNSLSSVAFKLYLRKSQLTGREKYSFTHMQTRNNYMSWLDLEVLLFEVNLLAI